MSQQRGLPALPLPVLGSDRQYSPAAEHMSVLVATAYMEEAERFDWL